MVSLITSVCFATKPHAYPCHFCIICSQHHVWLNHMFHLITSASSAAEPHIPLNHFSIMCNQTACSPFSLLCHLQPASCVAKPHVPTNHFSIYSQHHLRPNFFNPEDGGTNSQLLMKLTFV